MNAAETIAAAIEKLEELRGNASGGEWAALVDPGDRTHAPSWLIDADDVEMNFHNAEYRVGRNADLIVTLHRTLDAQLAILRAAQIEHTNAMTSIEKPYWDAAICLASAILGEAS